MHLTFLWSVEPKRCSSLLSFSTTHGVPRFDSYVSGHLVLIYVLLFHYSPKLVQRVAKLISSLHKRAKVFAEQKGTPAPLVKCCHYISCVLAITAGVQLTLWWLDGVWFTRENFMTAHFHYDLEAQNRHQMVVAAAVAVDQEMGGGNMTSAYRVHAGEFDSLRCPPVNVAFPSWHVDGQGTDVMEDELISIFLNGMGVGAFAADVMINVVAAVLVAIGLAGIPLHMKLPGTTSLSAYIFQFAFLFFVNPLPYAVGWGGWFHRLCNTLHLGPESPFRGLMQVLIALFYVYTVAPLLQFLVLLPQSRLLLWIVEQVSSLTAAALAPIQEQWEESPKRQKAAAVLLGWKAKAAQSIAERSGSVPRWLVPATSTRREATTSLLDGIDRSKMSGGGTIV
eukprot:2002605-Prymnesium_polylepis.1